MKIFLFFFLGYLVSFSQSKYSNDFLSIGIDSRSISMSNTVVSNVSDLTSVFYNPAGLNNVKSFELGVMHSSYFLQELLSMIMLELQCQSILIMCWG